ncbi:PRC-barrel domain-containing protein [Streptomyces sp. TRM70350]|uniref:PRC-barrel domain-containing protein n=1 Tax=Streptomyces sp. TRM70350 TaxID=2856165 RepID=UPI001C44614F|nr:PRC-barrel domain-containing protein [Streptomyces sp. TRM70350]MBV7697845.1 PRC-barrel domain-containing protein [Streptomyces sp. TRM70350]
MKSGDIPVLTRLSDSHHAIRSADEDVRGRKVTDRSGNELGKVGDLIIDEEEHKVRFLLLEHGGFLGIGEKKSYIPVDAVADVTEDHVRIDRTREEVADAPEYDPELVEQSEFYDRLYTHYGYVPFWGTGYVPPRFPYHP